MPRVLLSSVFLACLWGGAVLAAPPTPKRPAPPAKAAAPAPEADEAQLHFELGRELIDAGKLSEGLRELLQAHSASPQPPPETDFYLGLAYDGLQRVDAAILAYRRYLSQSPDSLNARNVRERVVLLEHRRGDNASPLLDPPPRPNRRTDRAPIPPLRLNEPPAEAPSPAPSRSRTKLATAPQG